MKREDYLNRRQTLVEEAQAALDNDELDTFDNKTKEVEDLDNKFAESEKKRANLEALNRVPDIPGAVNLMSGGKMDLNGAPDADPENVFESAEYKKALMNYVMKGAPMPEKFRNADAGTVSSEAAAVIPQTTVQKIIDKIEAEGGILSEITRTAYKGGVAIPVADAKPTAYWVSEGATTGDGIDTQQVTLGTSITFGYYKLRVAVRLSLEVTVMAWPVFEAHVVKVIAVAIRKALEAAVVSGNGSGKPKGILAETVVSGQNVDITEGNNITYVNLVEADALLPTGYADGARWYMTRYTFYNQVVGLKDTTGQPIARVDHGLDGKPVARILGREVTFIENGLADFAASVAADTIVAFLFKPDDYWMNTNYELALKKYTDEKTDDECMKSIMLVDGKVIDKNSLVTVTVKNG